MPDSKLYPLPDVAAVEARIAAAGGPKIDLSQPTGQATADGVTLSWVQNRGQVTVTLVKKPWIVPESTIWAHVDAVMV